MKTSNTYNGLKKLIKEQVSKILKEELATTTIRQSKPTQVDTLVEMARINKHEQGNSIFPFNSFEVQVWSNDHNPPHFHVLSNGCNISFLIETGEILNVESNGDLKTYQYILKNVKKWLNNKNSYQPKLTNKEAAEMYWSGMHCN